jgi:hypothetical protein
MYKENKNKNIEYFRLRLKDSEKSPFSKDLLLEWICAIEEREKGKK